jgi:predicted AAA+ superfamily ATPase
VQADLREKMVFIGGARQVGKTTFSLSLVGAPDKRHPAYLNWDVVADREEIMAARLPAGQKLIVLDEIHKYARWRNLVKGFYDKKAADTSFLITGSARLDYYSKGGDSLHGRYHYYRLHPFTLPELKSFKKTDTELLLRLGGFPEPLFKGEEKSLRRWRLERHRRIIHEDLRDLEHIREMSLIDLLLSLLPERVGSVLSVQKLREALQVSHESVERWLTALENMYVVYRLPPYTAKSIRGVKKEKKLFFWDWSTVPDEAARFENMVASHLLKYCHFIEDTEGYAMQLCFLRDTDGREIDFLVLKDHKPLFAVEVKSGERQLSKRIEYFKSRLGIPEVYQVHLGEKEFGDPRTTGLVTPFRKFSQRVGLV